MAARVTGVCFEIVGQIEVIVEVDRYFEDLHLLQKTIRKIQNFVIIISQILRS